MGSLRTERRKGSQPGEPASHPVRLLFESDPDGGMVALFEAFIRALTAQRGVPADTGLGLPDLRGPDGGTELVIDVPDPNVEAVYRLARGPSDDWTRVEKEAAEKFHQLMRQRNLRGSVENGRGLEPIVIPAMTEPVSRTVVGWWTAEIVRVGGPGVPNVDLKIDDPSASRAISCKLGEDLGDARAVARKLAQQLYEHIEVFGEAILADGRMERFTIERIEKHVPKQPAVKDLRKRIDELLDGRSIDTTLLRVEHPDVEA